MPPKDQTAARTPSGQKSRATGRPKGGSRPAGPLPVRSRLTLHTTAPEAEAVEAAARAAGDTVSTWLRRAVVEALRHADHARQVAAHLEVVGGMPGATD